MSRGLPVINWRRARLAAVAVKPEQWPRHSLPEVALVGRSNVGKSSLINHLVHAAIARTSNTPGRTQTINFYVIDDRLCLVDLPGYGYARVPQRIKRQWGPMIEGYLNRRENLIGILQVVDMRHPPTADDRAMAQWLRHRGLPAVAVATKADKIARGHWRGRVEAMARELGLPTIAFSAVSGAGRADLMQVLRGFLLEARLAAQLPAGSARGDGPDPELSDAGHPPASDPDTGPATVQRPDAPPAP
ncbi:MAG TPA: ribosome biogenesis GTP-binding protein YihA/YsxC [Limnochordales bacterium]|nr:ribosome biogenesis GTP-binding protein YihA/YsxC [Limnochordales bacterium]